MALLDAGEQRIARTLGLDTDEVDPGPEAPWIPVDGTAGRTL